MTVGGKIDTKRLVAELEQDGGVKAVNDWKTETEKKVALAWEAALGQSSGVAPCDIRPMRR